MAGQSCPSNFKLPMEAEGSVAGLQRFLNREIADGRLWNTGIRPLVVDGKCGPLTWAAWTKYIGGIAGEKGLPPPTTKPPVRVPPVIIAEPVYGLPSASADQPMWKKPIFWVVAVSGVALLILLTKKRR